MKFNVQFFVEAAHTVLSGIPITLLVVAVSLVVAIPLGFLLAVVRKKRVRVGAQAAAFFVSLMRGTPMIVQIYLVYTAMPLMLNSFVKSIGSEFNVFGINPVLYALTLFALNTTATLSEVFRSALSTVGDGQMEAAVTNGLSEPQAYIRIIIPQMMQAASAPLCNATVDLMKNSSLIFYMGIKDIMGIIKTEAGVGYNYFEGYVLAFLLYLALCFAVQLIYRLIELRVQRSRPRATT